MQEQNDEVLSESEMQEYIEEESIKEYLSCMDESDLINWIFKKLTKEEKEDILQELSEEYQYESQMF